MVTVGGALTGVGLASQPDGPAQTNVPTANTKADGYAPASVLSPELRQVVVAQGSTALENPTQLTSFYGYYNDVLNAAGQPQNAAAKAAHATPFKRPENGVFQPG